MLTWDIDLNLRFTINSDDITAFPNWNFNAGAFGPRRQIHAERQFLEDRAREAPDHVIAYYLSFVKANHRFTLREGPDPLAEGVDGELQILNNRFVTQSVAISNARVGKIIEVTAVNTPPLTRGFYRIQSRIDANTAELEGIVPINATGLTFRLWEPGNALIVLTSLAPV